MLVFEVLILDPARRSRCENALSLVHALRSYSRLWKDPHLLEGALQVTDGAMSLQVVEQEPTPSLSKEGNSSYRAYVVSLSGEYDHIEPLRVPLTEFLKDQDYEHRYVIKDEVSEYIACKLYPYLYRIENLLRGYLTKSMTTRIGPTWWQLTASTEMSNKAKIRKKNEMDFGRHVDNSAFLIDFDELGELVYEQSSGFLTRDDIVKRVTSLKESVEALHEFKRELRSNYQKYFQKAFADQDFKSKWKKWEDLRNKIAHNNLFTNDDLTVGTRLAEEITTIITNADQSTEELEITQGEREAMQEQVIAKTDDAASLPPQSEEGISLRRDITEEESLAELRNQESFYERKPDGFVGLTRFVRFHLGELGYAEKAARLMTDSLKKSGSIEVYSVENPYSSGTTAALRTV